MRTLTIPLLLAASSIDASVVHAAEAPALTLSFGDRVQSFTAAELLSRPDAATLVVPDDVAYGRQMTFRAVPLLALIGSSAGPALDTIEVRATDGFVSQSPWRWWQGRFDGVAWIAVEDPSAPWPRLSGKTVSAGPFYLVWEHPQRSGVGSEQWPYQVASLTGVQSPAHRWPQMAVDAGMAADAPARGQAVFTTQCMPCHRMKGAGAADIGPDLGQPMNPTQYMSSLGLRSLIRNPKAVRTWPQQQMPAFDAAMLSDADLDAVIAYLGHMAQTPRQPSR
jgi:mono/diheme cytochrome c family protein